jgi:hypothetical protein
MSDPRAVARKERLDKERRNLEEAEDTDDPESEPE